MVDVHGTGPAPILDFDAPPVVEVALSVDFRLLPRMGLVAVVDAWRTLYADRFPVVEEQGRLDRAQPDPSGQPTIRMLAQMPTPRLWFLNEAKTDLIQVQNDFFGRNWRKVDGTEEYPRYPVLREAFRADFERLSAHISDAGIGSIEPIAGEVTYINHIPLEGGLRLGDVVKFFDQSASGFPLEPDAGTLAVRMPFAIGPSHAGALTINAGTATRASDNASILSLQVTARGPVPSRDVDGTLAFFDVARAWVVRSFGDVTTEAMHRRWGRTR